MVVEADDTSDLPSSIFVLPKVNELRLPDRLGSLVPGMVETVNANLHRAIVCNGIYLECPWNEFSGHLATDVVLHTLNQTLPSAAQVHPVVLPLPTAPKIAIPVKRPRSGTMSHRGAGPGCGRLG